MSRDTLAPDDSASRIDDTLAAADQIAPTFDPTEIPAPEPAVIAAREGVASPEEIAAASPPTEQVFISTGESSSDQSFNAVLPGKISLLTRYWANADLVTRDSPFRIFTRGVQDVVIFGDTTDSNAATMFLPGLKLAGKIGQVVGMVPSNRTITPEERKVFEDSHPGAPPLPKHTNELMLMARRQDWFVNQVEKLTVAGARPAGLVGTAGDYFIQFAASALTNPGILLAGGIDGAFMGTSLRAWERLLGAAAKPVRFSTAKFASGASFAAVGVTFQEMQAQTFTPIQDLIDVGRSGWMFTTFGLLGKAAGVALKGPLKKAGDFLKRKHNTMEEDDAADVASAFVNQSARGTDPDMTIPLNKALQDQSIRFQADMKEAGVSKEDANNVLNEGDIELNADLEEKTRIQDEAEKAFKDAKIQPEFAMRLSDRLNEIGPDIEGRTEVGVNKESEENTVRRKQIQGQLVGLQKELETLKSAPEAKIPLLPKSFETLKRSLQDIINKTTEATEEQTKLLTKPLRESRRRLKELKTQLANLKRRRAKKETDLIERIKTEGEKTRVDLKAANELLREVRAKVSAEKIKPPVSKKKAAALKRDKINRLQKPILEDIKSLQEKLKAIRQPRKIADNATLVRFKQAEISGLIAENNFLFKRQTKLNDATGLFGERSDILKRLNRLLNKLGIKVEDTPETKLKAAMEDWNSKNEARRDAKLALRNSELLRHFVNNEEHFVKDDLDRFVNQLGPDKEPFAADRDKKTEFIPGRDVENASTELEDRFPKEEEDRIIKDANMSEREAREWDEINDAPENRKTLSAALKEASDCLLRTPR